MTVTVYPAPVSGSVTAPASKSVMQRVCAAALLAGGTTRVYNPGTSNDDNAALEIIRSLGAEVTTGNDGTAVIKSSGIPLQLKSNTIHCGESGLSVRMFLPVAALLPDVLTVTGSGSLLSRPLALFDDVLPVLGVQMSSQQGFLPVKVQGPLVPADITIDGSLSSQYLTGLLFAYSALNARATITVKNLNSKPYIDLTLQILRQFGLPLPLNENYERFVFNGTTSPSPASERTVFVEGDWSGGAFLLVLGACAGDITVEGLHSESTQGDKHILSVLSKAGVAMSVTDTAVTVKKSVIAPFECDASDTPDLFPPLVTLAVAAGGVSRIKGVHRLYHKESNRLVTLQEEFAKLGTHITAEDDTMVITPGKVQGPVVLSGRNDHRIVMAAATAAAVLNTTVTITGAEAVNKSYPLFFKHLNQLGIHTDINPSSADTMV